MAGIIDGIGFNRDQIIGRNVDGPLGLADRVGAALAPVCWFIPARIRAEHAFLPLDYRVGADITAY